MGWRLKSFQFKLFSLLPGGTRLYSFTQDYVTKSTTVTPGRINQKVNVGLDFWGWLEREKLSERLIQGQILDLGAGWHPIIPLLWYALGNNQQTLVDVFPNMTAPRVHETISVFRQTVGDANWSQRTLLKRLPALPVLSANSTAASVLAPLGIKYRAPYGDFLQAHPASFDVAICTQVLQHIPRPVLQAIFKEVHGSLKPGGLFHASVHFVGQFRSPDLRPGQYEHLCYSPDAWENQINSTLMSFNRLKGPDYVELLEGAGFRIREFRLTAATEAEVADLKRTRVHPSFHRYSEADLAARGVFFVAEKP
jgi:SAM-dependent methyltransferase